MKIEGVWLPVITPFYKGSIDFSSYVKLIDLYIKKGISGIIPLATTGESPTIEEFEFEQLLEKTVEVVNRRIPIYVGHGGNYTTKAIKQLKIIEKYNVDGILSVSPYYNLPSQEGIYEHFRKISEGTNLNILIYNIPYRTGINIENETIYKLAELENIVGIKDSCGNLKQSFELLLKPIRGFSHVTGEDASYFQHLTLGGSGGILAAAHLETKSYIDVFQNIRENNHHDALVKWRNLYPIISLLFQETNPAPLKYCLYKQGLIQSPETRLPVTGISSSLKEKLDKMIRTNN